MCIDTVGVDLRLCGCWCLNGRRYAEKVLDNRFAPTTLGLALIVGYSKLGIPLGKPYLRAAMETDCKRISDGVKDKDTVVRDCLNEVVRALLCFLFLHSFDRDVCVCPWVPPDASCV
jgi:hypothetical protein